jgi:hypothetical protein
LTRPGWKNWRSTRKIGAIMAALGLALLLLLPCAYADVKVEGWREQSYDYIVSNIHDFPDYVFLTSSVIWGWEYASILNRTGSFGGGYKLDGFQVHAIRSADFDKERFFSRRQENNQDAVNCTDYCRNNPGIVSSDLRLPTSVSVQEIIPLEKIEVYLKVDNITNRAFNITKTKMLYYYTNGTIKETNAEEL